MTRWLDHEEMRAWRTLVEVYADLDASLEAELQQHHGIGNGEYAVLVNLSEAPEQKLRMCDLAQRLHLSPSGLTRRLDAMVRHDLVAREPSPDDRRVILAALTPVGAATLERAAPDHVEGVRRHFLDHLSRTQIRQLGAALTAVHRARHSGASKQTGG